MACYIECPEFLDRSKELPIVDVRSPSEFAEGHMPGAVNVPVFSDEERARVGKVYKRVGREAAVKLGYELVAPKTGSYLQAVQDAAGDRRDLLLHCWRGGMRSEGMAGLLADHSFRPLVLRGGYKAFRREAHQSFEQPRKIIVLSGLTGCGKTKLLRALRDRGQQVIDLEGIAHHRGSAFGGLGQPGQPTVEQFENLLFGPWRNLDPTRPVWMEDEGQSIGRVYIPMALWHQMRAAPAIFLHATRDQRVDLLVEEYGSLPKEDLARATQTIEKRLGGQRLRETLALLERQDLRGFAESILEYYDKAYLHAKRSQPRSCVQHVTLTTAGDSHVVPRLCELGSQVYKRAATDPQDGNVNSPAATESPPPTARTQ